MAIDTQTKRRAAYNHLLITVLPVPDGTVDRVDREQVTGLYAGIDVSVTVAGPVNAFRTSVELRNQRGKLVKVFNRELATASWSFDRIGGCGSFRLGIKALFDEAIDEMKADASNRRWGSAPLAPRLGRT